MQEEGYPKSIHEMPLNQWMDGWVDAQDQSPGVDRVLDLLKIGCRHILIVFKIIFSLVLDTFYTLDMF